MIPKLTRARFVSALIDFLIFGILPNLVSDWLKTYFTDQKQPFLANNFLFFFYVLGFAIFLLLWWSWTRKDYYRIETLNKLSRHYGKYANATMHPLVENWQTVHPFIYYLWKEFTEDELRSLVEWGELKAETMHEGFKYKDYQR